MIGIALWLVLIAHMHASGVFEVSHHIAPTLHAPLVLRAEAPAIQQEANKLFDGCCSRLEIKHINRGGEVLGVVWDTNDSELWTVISFAFRKGSHGSFVQSNRLNELVKFGFLEREGEQIPGLFSFNKGDVAGFFPGDVIVLWRVGPVDWIFVNRVPGALTLHPVGWDYALHFEPSFTPNADKEGCCDVRRLELKLEKTSKALADVVIDVALLREEQKAIKSEILQSIRGSEANQYHVQQATPVDEDPPEYGSWMAWCTLFRRLVCCCACAR